MKKKFITFLLMVILLAGCQTKPPTSDMEFPVPQYVEDVQ